MQISRLPVRGINFITPHSNAGDKHSAIVKQDKIADIRVVMKEAASIGSGVRQLRERSGFARQAFRQQEIRFHSTPAPADGRPDAFVKIVPGDFGDDLEAGD
jgi:hypothetical protein